MQQQQIVILGGGYAGLMAAIRLAKKTKQQAVGITLVNATDKLIHRIRLHQVATQQDIEELSIPHLFKGTGIQFVQGFVTDIDLQAKQISVESNGGVQTLTYDKLVYALGSMTNRDTVKGLRDNAYTLDWDSTQKLAQHLPEIAKQKGRIIVVGSGATGLESATEFAGSYPDARVELVTQGTLAGYLSPKGIRHVRKVFNRLNITIHEQLPIAEISDSTVISETGDRLPYDAVIWTGGFVANPLAKQVGFAVNQVGQIKVDSRLHAQSHPDVYVVGDAADVPTIIDTKIRMSCYVANYMGAGVANIIVDELRGKVAQPFAISYFNLCISLGRKDGLIQFLHHDDSPRKAILTGRLAARYKELIVGNVTQALYIEKRLPLLAYWAGKNRLKNSDTVSKTVLSENYG